jgi:hypothetical protein
MAKLAISGGTETKTGRSAVRWLVFLFLWTVGTHNPARSQEITGRLLDSTTRDPIQLGSVVLLDTLLHDLLQVTSGSDGEFKFEVPSPGEYYLLGTALGYQRKLDGILRLEGEGRISVDFFLRPDPIRLDSLPVEARRRTILTHLQQQGFYDRLALGFGNFVTPEKIEERVPRGFRTLLRGLPNLRVIGSGQGRTELLVRWSGRECPPSVYVDGLLVSLRWEMPRYDYPHRGSLEEILSVEDIAAIEYYDGSSSIPLRWGGTSTGRTCGVIVFWTKGE